MNKKNILLGLSIVSIYLLSLANTVKASTGAQIIIDPITKKIYITTGYFQNTGTDKGSFVSTSNNSGTISTGTTSTANSGIVSTATTVSTATSTYNSGIVSTTTTTISTQSSEYEQALAWMFANGLTKYSDSKAYRPDDYLTRQESAKLLGQLYVVLGYNQSVKGTGCTFADAKDFDPSLSSFIKSSCEWGLFKGYKGNFMYQQSLTRPQSMAVIIRMFQQKLSNENTNPRWSEYYLKGWTLGLIDDSNINTYDKIITRKEIAIYIFRLKNIAENEKLKALSLNAISQVSAVDNTINKDVFSSNLEALQQSIDSSKSPELQEAVKRMYNNGLTVHSSVQEYKPYTILLRQEAAKMLDKFAILFGLNTVYNTLPNQCNFLDKDQIEPSLLEHVEAVCKMGLLKGINGQFEPTKQILKSDFVVALVKLLDQKVLDETVNPRWLKYFERAEELGIAGPADAVTFENPITRYEVALFLYRFKVKYQMLKNLNTSKLQNEVVTTVAGSIATGVDGGKVANIYINTNLLSDGNFEIGYIETFGNRYKLVKTSQEAYFSDNFVWYGDLKKIDDNTKIGTVSFIMGSNILIEGSLRLDLDKKDFILSQVPNTNAYYAIKEIIR